MAFKNSYKKVKKDVAKYVNTETGEVLGSEDKVSSMNVVDPNYYIVDSKQYVIVDIEAMQYLETILAPRDMYYVRIMTEMCQGEYNALYDNDKTPYDRASLQERFNLAKNRFVKLMKELYVKGVINYMLSHHNGKEMKFILLNPSIARRTKRLNVYTKKLFADLS